MINGTKILSLFALSLIFAGTLTIAPQAMAEDRPLLLAQVEPDEAYDPFIDYSEFEEESDEEADINFFRNGRFLTLGMAAGTRGFTGNFSDMYKSNLNFGLIMTYFFDLRLAMSLGFQTGDHAVKIATTQNTYDGNVSITSINADLKYYFNTQNVTRGLADLNPYALLGVGQFYRTYNLSRTNSYSKDNTVGFNLGAGLEIPLMRKKAFLGLQAVYHLVEFDDENSRYIDGNEYALKEPSGDFYSFLVILGMNF